MKKFLILLVFFLLVLDGYAQTFKIQKVKRTYQGATQRGRARRDMGLYPSTSDGNASFFTAVNAGCISISVTGGAVIPVSSSCTSSTVSPGPSWIAGLRYSHNGTTLTVQGAGDIATMAFGTSPPTTFTASNPDGVPIVSGTFYASGSIAQGIYTKQWQVNKAPTSFSITAKNSADATYSVVFTATTGASNVTLVAPSSTTTVNPGSYSRIFIVGNSITHNHYTRPGETNERDNGMDASSPAQDYFHILTNKFQTANPGAQVREFVSFVGSPVPSGTYQFDVADGPRWEQKYWHLNDSDDIFRGGLDRYQAIADWMPDLIIMRIAENVSDLSHDFPTAYKALIDKLKSKNPSCRVLLTTSVWNTLNQTQVDVSSQITSVGSERGYTVVNLNNISGATLGTANHPNDAAMQTIADRIWTGVGISSGATNVVGPNLPPWETFDYQPITTNQSWTEYDTRKYDGTHEVGDKIVLDNGQVRAEIWKNWGGSVAHISVSGTGINLVNQNKDKGRGGDITWYRGGRTRQIESENKEIFPGWASPEGGGVGNDPISIGDFFDNPSPVVAIGRSLDGSMVYVKTQMMNWAVRNDLTDMFREHWVSLSGKEVRIRSRLTANRTMDKTPYEARLQEYPTLYVNAPWATMAYAGSDGNIHYQADGNLQTFRISEPWVAMVNAGNSSATGLGLFRTGFYETVHKLQGGGGSGEFDGSAGQTSGSQHIQSDWNGVYYGDHSYYVGSVSDIRTWANAKPNPRNKLSWKFNERNGRGWFWYHDAQDTGFPTPNTGIIVSPQKSDGRHVITWPDVSISSSAVSQICIRYKASTNYITSAQLLVGQTDDSEFAMENRVANFSIINDNQWHTAIIPMSSVSNYGGKISRVMYRGFNAPTSSTIQIAWVNTVDTDPEP